jgi:hypothetical protein
MRTEKIEDRTERLLPLFFDDFSVFILEFASIRVIRGQWFELLRLSTARYANPGIV